jgi:hypothetical protein
MSFTTKKDYQHFTTEAELIAPVTPGSAVDVRSSCGDITFTNYHPTLMAYVDGQPLAPAVVAGQPGGSIVFGAKTSEYNESNYKVLAPPPAADPDGLNSLGVWVNRQHYTTVGPIKID